MLPSAYLLLTHHGCDVTDPLRPKSFGLFYLQTLASSPADTKALGTLQNPQSSSPHAPQIWALLSALSSSLDRQLFLSQAPMLSCQPFPEVICTSVVLHSSTNTVQNTSFPTRCLHRANLQYNYFLMLITEALKDEYKSHPHALWCYIQCEGI